MKKAFTLLELVVVLLVIALATHLAVREVAHIRNEKLVSAADSQLEEIRKASLAFLSDVGRPVSVTNGTLSELWVKPDDVLEYRLRPASAANLATGVDPALAASSIRVPAGWRGPYIRLKSGRTKLRDPWGNAIELFDEAHLPRITLTNLFYAAQVSHYGANGRIADKRTVDILPKNYSSSSLTVWARGNGLSGDVKLAWYGPASGMITGCVKTVSANVQHTFEGLTPGNRIVTAAKAGSSVPVVRLVEILPGDNLLEIEIP